MHAPAHLQTNGWTHGTGGQDVLHEKYQLEKQDAKELADFITPMLDFVAENRATALVCSVWMDMCLDMAAAPFGPGQTT